MGVLDDAIREHLDLKRRHGAEEEELRRQEEEALGPARREVAPAEAEDGNGTGEQAPAAVEPAQTALDDEPELSDVVADDAVHSAEEETELHELPADEAEPEAPHEEPPAAHRDEALAEPPPSARADSAFDEEPAFDEDEQTVAGDTPSQGFEPVDDDDRHDDEPLEEAAERSGEDADLLKDTPDFLQETPEHDRLWFEQKPPRDFDFD